MVLFSGFEKRSKKLALFSFDQKQLEMRNEKIRKEIIMKKLVILMLAFLFVMTGCSKTHNDTIQEPSVNDIVETNRVTKLEKLKSTTTTIGDVNMFGSVDETLYTNIYIINTYDEFEYLCTKFNSNKNVFQKLIDLLKNMNYAVSYFENKSLIISPFLHSSDEKNISLLDIQINDSLKKIDITFQFESPEYVDCDVIVDYFVIEIEKQDFIERNDYIKNIYGYNLLTNRKESSCYR